MGGVSVDFLMFFNDTFSKSVTSVDQ